MGAEVSVATVEPRRLAAVRRRVAIGAVGSAWRPALDAVWAFLRERPGLRSDGHNVFVYHRPADGAAVMDVDFGVEVTREFEPSGEVRPTATPAGEVASAVHVGAYGALGETDAAIHRWAAAHRRTFANTSWEIYGDWSEDEAKLETTVVYLLTNREARSPTARASS